MSEGADAPRPGCAAGLPAGMFIEQARARGFRLYTGVPCSYLQHLVDRARASSCVRYVGACNEGDAVALAAGAHLGGTRAIVLLQNSGLGNVVNPLTSLHQVFELPLFMIVTLRGEPGGPPDEPQHAVMGPLTCRLLEVLGVTWEWFPREASQVEGVLDRALAAYEAGRPHALVMRKDSVAPEPPLPPRPGAMVCRGACPPAPPAPVSFGRAEVLERIRRDVGGTDVLVATTGYTGRALYALGDELRSFYMVGSMGCASSLGLGLALARPDRRVIVVDGDGAVLMRMGALAAVGAEHPPNLVHVVLDNRCYDSTGGQSTPTDTVDLAGVAWACGYARVIRAESLDDVGDGLLGAPEGPVFIHVQTRPEGGTGLPRPDVSPPSVARRLMGWLEASRPGDREGVAPPPRVESCPRESPER